MPTKREREYYRMGFMDAMKQSIRSSGGTASGMFKERPDMNGRLYDELGQAFPERKPKRKLSPWNKFVKANSKKPRFIYKSGSNKGKLNLKKMGVAFRKTPAGKRKK
tara:strand:+ start:253 stop:573 length:321 start_codon:yes stop_codon:yes gene_type:complete